MAKLLLQPKHKPKPEPKVKPQHIPKWPWELLYQLYMSGMEPRNLIEIPEAKGLTITYLRKKMQDENWAEKRRLQLGLLRGQVGKSMDETFKEQVERHYRFMVKQIEDERDIIARRLKTTDLPAQKERIALLEKYAAIAAKTLGLENESVTDQNKNGYNILIAVQDPRSAQDFMARNFAQIKNATPELTPSYQTTPDEPEALQQPHSAQETPSQTDPNHQQAAPQLSPSERAAQIIANDITPAHIARRDMRIKGTAAGISPVIDVTPQAILADFRKNPALQKN